MRPAIGNKNPGLAFLFSACSRPRLNFLSWRMVAEWFQESILPCFVVRTRSRPSSMRCRPPSSRSTAPAITQSASRAMRIPLIDYGSALLETTHRSSGM